MPASIRTTDEITAQRLENGVEETIHLSGMSLFASGAFSNVYRGTARLKDEANMDIVIKKTWPTTKMAPIEVKILGILDKAKHKNIVRLLYSFQNKHGSRICLGLIFECIPYNLHLFLKEHERKMDVVEVKLITWQLFRGQAHLQRMQITHRDIKPQNLLYDPETGLLKISDFGSSTDRSSKTAQASYHVTRYYRPPELILGSKYYGPELDIWSCGCVFGELLKGGIFLPGTSGDNQGEHIFDMIGLPKKEELQAMKVNSEKYDQLIAKYKPDVTKCTANMSFLLDRRSLNHNNRKIRVTNDKINMLEMKDSVDLLRKVLVYDPSKRRTGTEFLVDPFFKELFKDNTVRFNRKKIGCLTSRDLVVVKNGDTTITDETGEETVH